MAKLSKIEHDALIALDPADLTNEDRRDIIDFEREEAKAPSLDDVEWASAIHDMATKNPSTDGIALKETGDYDKALKILEQERAYNAIKGGQANKNYVQPVKRIPDDLNSEFNFNWKSAYENVKNEKLRDTEADYDKLKKFIDSNMYDLDDPTTLQKIAHDLHMYNSNTMKWTDFINSEQGEEFKKYLADVRENQRKNEVEKIFSGEEPSESYYPGLGSVNVPGSNAIVDFMAPVTKEAAKRALVKGEEPKLLGPGSIDAFANLAMTLGGKPGLFVAPAITNAGQVGFNDADRTEAVINTLLGTSTNMVAPYMLKRGTRYINTPGKGYSRRIAVQQRADELANNAAKTLDEYKKGAVHELRSNIKEDPKTGKEYTDLLGFINKDRKIIYTDDPETIVKYAKDGFTIKPRESVKQHDAGVISTNDWNSMFANKKLLRQSIGQYTDIKRPKDIIKDIKHGIANIKANENDRAKAYKIFNNPQGAAVKVRERVVNDVLDKLSKYGEKAVASMKLPELYALGYNPKESLVNFIAREFPDAAKNYLVNIAGRNANANNAISVLNNILGVNLSKMSDRSKKKPKISEIFGGE